MQLFGKAENCVTQITAQPDITRSARRWMIFSVHDKITQGRREKFLAKLTETLSKQRRKSEDRGGCRVTVPELLIT